MAAAPGMRAQDAGLLPAAPEPMLSAVQSQQTGAGGSGAADHIEKLPGKPDPGKAGSVDRAPLEKRKWSRYVDPGERVPVLDADEKMVFWQHEEVRWYAPIPAFISAGFGQLTDGDPKYGVDSGAGGERLGTALIRQASMRFMTDSLFPVIFHEDPRYFRKAAGGYGGRALWAAERALVSQRNSGRRSFNNSDIWGHLAASALTQVYYPDSSRSGRVVIQTWLTSIAGAAGNNEFLEFWPDAINAWRRHRARVRAASGR